MKDERVVSAFPSFLSVLLNCFVCIKVIESIDTSTKRAIEPNLTQPFLPANYNKCKDIHRKMQKYLFKWQVQVNFLELTKFLLNIYYCCKKKKTCLSQPIGFKWENSAIKLLLFPSSHWHIFRKNMRKHIGQMGQPTEDIWWPQSNFCGYQVMVSV